MNFAVADLGTNTFHLLIADANGTILSVTEYPVLLGQAVSAEQVLTKEALQRMESALGNMHESLSRFQPCQIRAVATSAIRTAGNAAEAQLLIAQYIGIIPELISGDQEAQYIYAGVHQIFPDHSAVSLVMDIGGGSTEFIMGCGSEILWKQSFLLGAARLKAAFPSQDPPTDVEVEALNHYIKSELAPLMAALQEYKPTIFIGASGAFETIAALNKIHLQPGRISEFPKNQWRNTYHLFRCSTRQEQRNFPGMPEFRVPMMPYALELIRLVLEELNPHKIYISPSALKEGILMEMLEM